jgi:hypothetical protein
MARRMPLPRSVAVVRSTRTGETGGGQPIYSDEAIGTVRARIDALGVGRGAPVQEVSGPNLEPVVADYHALTELELEQGEPENPGDPPPPRQPANLTERDYLSDATGVYEILTVGLAEDRATGHHYELKLRKVTP